MEKRLEKICVRCREREKKLSKSAHERREEIYAQGKDFRILHKAILARETTWSEVTSVTAVKETMGRCYVTIDRARCQNWTLKLGQSVEDGAIEAALFLELKKTPKRDAIKGFDDLEQACNKLAYYFAHLLERGPAKKHIVEALPVLIGEMGPAEIKVVVEGFLALETQVRSIRMGIENAAKKPKSRRQLAGLLEQS